jgi:hypothetical protein
VKQCFKCNESKPLDDFYKHPAMGDGRLGKCKECTKLDVSKHYIDTHDERRAYERARFQRPERKAKLIEYQRGMRERNPEKYAARNAVCNAIRDGVMERQPCEVCGDAKSEAHHTDYSKPLDVQWLCRFHHRKAHGQLQHIE